MEIRAPEMRQLDEICDLAGKCFGQYFDFYAHCQGGYVRGSSYDWEASRVILDAGRIVSHVGVWQYRMRVGQGRLKSGGIGIVMTDGRYRKQGLNTQVMNATMTGMRDAGYDYSVLFGVKDYYHRFGFCQIWPWAKLRAEAADLPETPLTLTLQERPLGEILWGSGAVMDIYNRDNATRTGTAERPVYTINESPHWKDNRLHALVNTSGQTVGYVVATKDGADLAVLEVGGLADDCGIGQLIAAIAALAKSNACTRVQVINHSLGHPLMQALHCGNCKLEIEHFRSGGPMGATVNLRQCLGAMQEELSLRCANSAWNDVSTSLSIQGQDETVTLQLSNGQVRVMDEAASANRLICGVLSARLIVGSESPSDLLYQGLKGEGGALALAEVLFPPQCPMLHRLDAF